MGTRMTTLCITSKEEIPERVKLEYHGFLPGRLTAKNLLKWMESEWLWKSTPPTETAKEALKETDQETAIALLVELLQDGNHRWEEALLLAQIDPGNEIALTYLIKLSGPNWGGEDRLRGISFLGQIYSGNEAAIAALVETIQNKEIALDYRLEAAESLAKIDPGNKAAIISLVDDLQTEENEYSRLVLAYSLGQIDPGNKTAVNTLVQKIHDTQDKYFRTQALPLNNLDETSRINVLDNIRKLRGRCRIEAECLGEIDPGNETAINALVELLDPNPNEDEYIRYIPSPRGEVAESLGRIDPGNEKAIATLVELIESADTAEDEAWEIVSEAVMSLGEIGIGNEKAINTLVKLIQNGWDQEELIAETLGKIDPGNEIAITTLLKLILDGGDIEEVMNEEVMNIEDMGAGAESLERILQGEQYAKVVTALKHYMTQDLIPFPYTYFYQPCHDVVWRCAQNMSYPDFYRAWHGKPSSV